MEAECRNSLQAGCAVDLTSQKCWGGKKKHWKVSFLPFIFTGAPQTFVAASIPGSFLHSSFSDVLLENPILAKVFRMGSHPVEISRDKKRRAIQVKTERKVNQINFCQCYFRLFRSVIQRADSLNKRATE